jgi:metal-dependent amidase/aminoacylase/carboxypeptidase family protein
VSVGTIDGCSRFNIIADSVTMTGTVRTLEKDGHATVKARMDAILKGITSPYDASYTLDYVSATPITFNDPALVTRSLPALKAVAGDNVVARQSREEDHGDVAHRVLRPRTRMPSASACGHWPGWSWTTCTGNKRLSPNGDLTGPSSYG